MTLPQPALDCMAALGRYLGLPELQLDQSGLLALTIGDSTLVHVQFDEHAHEFLLFGIAATLPPSPTADQLTLLLQANHFWHDTGGATLSLDDEQPPRLMLARRVDWQSCTPAEFVECFGHFAAYLAAWQRKVADQDAPAALSRPYGAFA